MTTDDVLAKLDCVTGRAGGWMARCPAHEDRTPSLSVSVGRDGRTLVRCHAGCEPLAVVDSLGLRMADLMGADGPSTRRAGRSAAKRTSTKATTRRPGRVVNTYAYTDEDDELLFEVVRRAPKQFAQRRPDEGGGWSWSLGDTRRVLFRLPQIIEASALEKRIYVAEGEKDVLALGQIGAIATCNPMGAGKWRPEYSEALRGARVVLLPDKDDAGWEHMESVAVALDRVAASVVAVDLAPRGAKRGHDVSDWVAAGGTLMELERLRP